MLYGKMIDGVIIYAPPEIYKENGEVIILKTPSDYYDNGYKRVIRQIPNYNVHKQVLALDNIQENDSEIIINYKLVNVDPLQSYNDILEEEVNR